MLMDPDAIRAAFDKHRTTPHVATEEYVRDRQIELGESVAARERVYLDKRYWIILRDSILGRNVDTSVASVLAGLRARVKSKRSICPISETVFIELLKQTDLETRHATAILIDELSEGITLLPHPERVAAEFAHFLYSQANAKVYPLEVLVWSKLSYVLGVEHPTIPHYPDSEQCTMQKAFFDHMWQCSLTEMMDMLRNTPLPHFDFDALAARLNEGSSLHASAIRSFPQVYKAEIQGSLSSPFQKFAHVYIRPPSSDAGSAPNDFACARSRR